MNDKNSSTNKLRETTKMPYEQQKSKESGFGLSNDPIFREKRNTDSGMTPRGSGGLATISESKKLDWIESLTTKDWEYIMVLGKEKVYGHNEVIAKASDENKAFFRIQSGRVIESVNGKTIRMMEKSTFGTHYGLHSHAGNKTSLFVSDENMTSVTRLDLHTLHFFFESHCLIGKKFYQNLCLMLVPAIRKLSRTFVRISTNPMLNDIDIRETLEVDDVMEPETIKEDEPTTKFLNLFGFPKSETLLLTTTCKYKKVMHTFGHLYVSSNYVCFVGTSFGKEFKLKIEIQKIKSVKSDLDNKKSVLINTSSHKFFFNKIPDPEALSKLILSLAQKKKTENKLKTSNLSTGGLQDSFELLDEDWSILLMGSSRKIYPPNTKVLNIGVYVDQIFYIVKGSCKVTIPEKDNEVEVAVLNEGNFFGEMSFFEDNTTTASVSTREESEIISIHKDRLLILLRRSSFLACKFFKYMSDLLSQRYKDMLKQNLQL